MAHCRCDRAKHPISPWAYVALAVLDDFLALQFISLFNKYEYADDIINGDLILVVEM